MLKINFNPHDAKSIGFAHTIEKLWLEKEPLIVQKFKLITGLDLKGEFNVKVFEPTKEIAHYLDEKNIEWGYAELAPGYILYGLAHEMLHCLTHEPYSAMTEEDKWTFHALVYLSMDEEMRFALNGESDYFNSPIVDTYHPKLITRAKEILPSWKLYIKKGNSNLLSLFQTLKHKHLQ